MSTKTTVDGNGELVEQTVEGPRVSVNFEHSLTEYGNGPKASLHLSVPLDEDADTQAVSAEVKRLFATAKAHVYEQLGVPTQVDDQTGVVVGLLEKKLGVTEVNGTPTRQPARKAVAPTAKPSGPRKPSGRPDAAKIDAAWSDYFENPEKWFDNRPKKADGSYKPNAADFKSRQGGFDGGGFSLWLSDAPDNIKAFFDGEEPF